MILGEQCPNRLTGQDLRAMVLVEELKYLLVGGSPLKTFKVNLTNAYQPQEGEKDQGLLNNVLGLMIRNNMIENPYILKAVGAAVSLKPRELKRMIKEIKGKVAVNPSRQ